MNGNTSNVDLQSSAKNGIHPLAISQSELSQSLMNAVDMPINA